MGGVKEAWLNYIKLVGSKYGLTSATRVIQYYIDDYLIGAEAIELLMRRLMDNITIERVLEVGDQQTSSRGWLQ